MKLSTLNWPDYMVNYYSDDVLSFRFERAAMFDYRVYKTTQRLGESLAAHVFALNVNDARRQLAAYARDESGSVVFTV